MKKLSLLENELHEENERLAKTDLGKDLKCTFDKEMKTISIKQMHAAGGSISIDLTEDEIKNFLSFIEEHFGNSIYEARNNSDTETSK